MAADFTPAVIFDMGGKFDKSFNEAAYNGAEKFKKETGIAYLEFEITNESQREQALRRMAAARRQRGDRASASRRPPPLEDVAKEFPNVKFVIIDVGGRRCPTCSRSSSRSTRARSWSAWLAAMASKTGKVGFVGGMDIPLIRKFACGYEQGVKYVNPEAEVFVNMTGTTPAAWNDPAKGGELAQSQFDRGADVVYAAAGGTGLGVLPGGQGCRQARRSASTATRTTCSPAPC